MELYSDCNGQESEKDYMYTLIYLYLSEFCYVPESCTTL